MGMLTYGAMAGVGGEYLKQSEEERTNEYQAIRDKRLSGLKKEEATHASELAAGREQSQRNYESSNYSFGYGENVVRGGEVVQTGGDRPTSSSTKPVDPAKRMLLMRNGDHTSLEQLRKEYETEYMKDRDDLGNPIMDPNAPSLIEYRNSVLDPKHALILEQIESGEIEPPEPAEKPGL
ncbi:MAG: hypothetical protein OES09_10630, partial [Gammaproteobacteria bacterium]|nr:hypothetical protein [Gammaproteobacteria bacterium]